MKNFLSILVLTAGLVLCFNAKSFADGVSVSAWGGLGSGNFELTNHSNFKFNFWSCHEMFAKVAVNFARLIR